MLATHISLGEQFWKSFSDREKYHQPNVDRGETELSPDLSCHHWIICHCLGIRRILLGLNSAWSETSGGFSFRVTSCINSLLSHENVISSVYNQDKVVRRCVVECFQSNLKGERLFESLTFYRHVLQKKMKHVSFALILLDIKIIKMKKLKSWRLSARKANFKC